MVQVNTELPVHFAPGPIEGIADVVAFLHVVVVGGTGRTDIGESVKAIRVRTELKQRCTAHGKAGQSQFRCKVLAALDGEPGRKVIAERGPSVVQTQLVGQIGGEAVGIRNHDLLRIAVGTAVAVDVASEPGGAYSRHQRVANAHTVVGCDDLVEPARVTRFILLHEAVDEKILDVTVYVQEVRTRVGHELQRLERGRTQHVLRNHIAGKGYGRGQGLQLVAYQVELLEDRGRTDRSEVKLLRHVGGQPTTVGAHQVAEIAVAHGVGRQNRSLRQEVLPPSWFVREEEESSIVAVVELWDDHRSTYRQRTLVVAEIIRGRVRLATPLLRASEGVACVPQRCAVQIVATGLGSGVDYAAAGLTVLRGGR